MANRRLLAALVGGCLACAGTARATSLITVVEAALDHDAQFAQALAGYAAAQQALPQARAGLLPHVAGGWGRSYNRIETAGLPRASYWQSGWTVALSQPVFDWTRWTTYKQADLIEARGAVEVDRARQATLLRATTIYFDMLSAEDEARRVADYLAAIDAQQALLRRRRAAGEATVIDLGDAAALRERVIVQQMDADHALAAARRALEQQLGAEVLTPLSRVAASIAMPPLVPADPESWAEQAREHAYPVQLNQLDWRIAQLDVEKSNAGHYPVVSVAASYTPAGAAEGYARPTTTTTGMLTVTIPLFSGGEVQSKIKEAQALEDKARDGLLAASREAEAAARNSYARYLWSRERVEHLAQLLRTCRDALAATGTGYRVGSRTSTDVLRAIDALYSTQRDLMAARYAAVLALLTLKADTATLDLTDIAQIDAMLTRP
jgi:outer membrane protein